MNNREWKRERERERKPDIDVYKYTEKFSLRNTVTSKYINWIAENENDRQISTFYFSFCWTNSTKSETNNFLMIYGKMCNLLYQT